jgi:signal transduction histidine kinase
MRFTVSRKIIISFSIVLIIGILSMLVIYNGLNEVKIAMTELADIKKPLNAAAHEMEINMNGMAMGVLNYLQTTDPKYRQHVEKDAVDFKRFHNQFFQLLEVHQLRELNEKIGLLYNDFEILGREMMDKKDKQEEAFFVVGGNFERIDDILDHHIQPSIDIQGPDGFLKSTKSKNLEADIAEVGLWLANYQRLRKDEYKKLIFEHEREFLESLTEFKELNLNDYEWHWVELLEGIFNQVAPLIRQVLTLEDYLQAMGTLFIALRAEMDAILDEEMDLIIREELSAPRKEADQATAQVIDTIQFLMPLFAVFALSSAALLIRIITTPIKRLMAGTEAVSHGDLRYRLVPTGQDEFTELAQHFNQMVAQLEMTTVSKGLLEASEQKLRETVGDLRHEIAERQRAEEEQARLQASLRRSETMAAMGSLVAGVAHEVRNPLFGISSTLDAFEARFGAREEFQRYLAILRGELRRLTELTRELLEYGRPLSLELSPGKVEEVIDAAIEACAPLAQRLNVRVADRVSEGLPPVLRDQRRLLQVFQNLLENAIHHSPTGGLVAVEVAKVYEDEKAWIDCVIKDSGPGFRPEDLPWIFEPFFTRRRGGTGLGLSIAQRIVEEHHGTITAGNRTEGGGVVTVRLPLAEP